MSFPKHIVAVAAAVEDENGRMLLVRHPQRGWELPGGQVELCEDLIEAVQREVEEESGIAISVEKMAAVYSNVKIINDEIPTKVIFDFTAKKLSGEPRTSSESLEVGWYNKNDVLEMVTRPAMKERIKTVFNFNGSVIYQAYSNNPYEVYKRRFI